MKPFTNLNLFYTWLILSSKLLTLVFSDLFFLKKYNKFLYLNKSLVKVTSLGPNKLFSKNTFSEFKSLHNLNLKTFNKLKVTNVFSEPVISEVRNTDLILLFKVYLTTNSFSYKYFLAIHSSWRGFFYTNSKSGVSIINLNKMFSKWKNFYYLFFNLFYYSINMVVFGTSFFKKELVSLNWSLFSNIKHLWRYAKPFLFLKSNKIFTLGEYIFSRLKLQGVNLALIVDVLYHNKTIHYLHRSSFFTFGLVPLTYNLHTVNFALPTSTENLFTQLFFIRFFLKIKESTKLSQYKKFKSTWSNFYQNL